MWDGEPESGYVRCMFSDLTSIFPDTASTLDGELTIGGIRATELTALFGSPLLVLDEETIQSRTRAWIDAFAPWEPGCQVAFACKSLCVGAALELTSAEGAGADVASAGELAIARAAGISGQDIVLHGNNKYRADLMFAVREGVGLIVLDAPDELDLLEEVVAELQAPPQAVLVRVNPDIEVETHRYIRTGHAGSKFGVCADTAQEMLTRAAKSPHLVPRGIHMHLGSQLLSLDPWRQVLTWLGPFARTLADAGVPIEVLDLGGGLGIRYLEHQHPPTIRDVANLTMSMIRSAWSEYGLDTLPQLIVEPGRSIIGNAGVTLYSVGVVKRDGPIGYVNVDGGMSDNPRPMLYQAEYRCLIADRATTPPDGKWWIAGVHCESGDVLIEDAPLPAPHRGDTLAVAGTGAYTVSMGSNYNAHPRPAVVMVADGVAQIAVRRESIADVVCRDVIAATSIVSNTVHV